MLMRTTSCGFPGVTPPRSQQLQTSLSMPLGSLGPAPPAPHCCTRFCEFDHQVSLIVVALRLTLRDNTLFEDSRLAVSSTQALSH